MLSLLQRWWGVRLVSTLRLLPPIYRLCSGQNQSYDFIVGSPPVQHRRPSLPTVSRFPLNLGHLGVNKVHSFDIVVHLHRRENVCSAPPSAPFLVQTKQWALGPQSPLGLFRDGEVRGWGWGGVERSGSTCLTPTRYIFFVFFWSPPQRLCIKVGGCVSFYCFVKVWGQSHSTVSINHNF